MGLVALRTALLENGYQEHAQAARYARGAFSRAEALPDVARTRHGGTLDCLLDLFAYGATVEHDGFGALRPELLARAGILQKVPGGWRSRVTIAGHGDVFALGDLRRRAQRRDHVDAYTTAAGLARKLAVRPEPGQRVLDLGSGSGIHALLAARAGASAVGADINARALKLARLGAQLSAVDDVVWREGSWFEPVAGERFDRIVCVAPYVLSPDREFTFRDGEPGGEDPVEAIASVAGDYLTPGGCALLMCCWGHGASADWRATPLGWMQECEADVLLLRLTETDPVTYALDWNRPPMRTLAPGAHDRVMSRWLAHYAEQGYGRISFGALAIRRRAREGASPAAHVALDAREGAVGEHGGEQLGRALVNLEMLANNDVREVVAAIPEGQRVEQRLQHDGNAYRMRRVAVRQAQGLAHSVAIRTRTLEVMYRLDGRQTIAQTLAETGVSGPDEGEALAEIRELLAAGLLVQMPSH